MEIKLKGGWLLYRSGLRFLIGGREDSFLSPTKMPFDANFAGGKMGTFTGLSKQKSSRRHMKKARHFRIAITPLLQYDSTLRITIGRREDPHQTYWPQIGIDRNPDPTLYKPLAS